MLKPKHISSKKKSKIKYASLRQAEGAATAANKLRANPLEFYAPYLCPTCSLWHIGKL